MVRLLKNIRIVSNYCIRFGITRGWQILRRLNSKTQKVKTVYVPGLLTAITLRHNSSDTEVFEQIFLNEEYRFSVKMHLDHIGYIVDCGANIGMSSLYFYLQYQQAKIMAVELEKGNYEMLAQNVAGVQNIIPVHAGVWSQNTLLQIEDIPANNWGFRAEEGMSTAVSTIEGLTISELMKRYQFPRIDILKIDIEGGELELFAENSETFLPKVRFIVIEFHDWIKPGTARAFFSAISSYKYFLFPNGENVFCELLHPQSLYLTYPDV